MNLAEKILVVCDQEVSYNLCPGGLGGFGFINSNTELVIQRNIKISSSRDYNDPKFLKQMSEFSRNRDTLYMKELHKTGKFDNFYFGNNFEKDSKMQSDEVKQKRKETFKKIGHQQGEKNSNYGKPRSEETKRKISESMIKRKISS